MRWSRALKASRRSTGKSSTKFSPARRRKPPPPRQPPNTPARPQLIVAGRGNLGRSLARGLRDAGHRVRLVSARTGLPKLLRTFESRAVAVVFLTVPDSAVAAVATRLAAGGAAIPDTVAFVHVSGALELGALAPLSGRHLVGSFHPLRSFPEPGPPEAFRGIVVAVDASSASLRRDLDRLARDLGAKPRRVDDSHRALYLSLIHI